MDYSGTSMQLKEKDDRIAAFKAQIAELEQLLSQSKTEVDIARQELVAHRKCPESIGIGEATDAILDMMSDDDDYWTAQVNCAEGVTLSITLQRMSDGALTPAKMIEEKDKQIAELEQDKERLDWIEANSDVLGAYYHDVNGWIWEVDGINDDYPTARAAIDAARKGTST